jgi:7-cyano-7-deazaguanine synthase
MREHKVDYKEAVVKTEGKKGVVVLSGGLDSTTLLYEAVKVRKMDIVKTVSFNYGQRHKKELEFARRTSERFGIPHVIIDLWASGLTAALSSSESSLISDTEVPEGHYAEESMKATVVPNRNMIMLSIATGIAVAEGAAHVLAGMHAGDHFIYPDCRPEFVAYTSVAAIVGNEGFGEFKGIMAPYVDSTKQDIAEIALLAGVPLHETWSCYKGGEKHCGKCGTCVERIEAIQGAIQRLGGGFGLSYEDKTEYEDGEFWREALKRETV